MKKLKYLLFLFIIFLVPNVFAQEVDVTDYCYGTTGYPRMYSGEEIQYQTYQSYSFGTTYQFQLASISTELRYNLSANTEYTFILNAADDDFRNNFRIWRAYDQNDNNTDLVTGFTYIGYRKIQLTFKTNSATNNVRIVFGSGDVYTNITGDVNWTLQNAVLVIPDSENQEIIDNNNGNTQDIINNNNSNTQDIIENQNNNTQIINETIVNQFQSCRNSINLLPSIEIGDISTETGQNQGGNNFARSSNTDYIPVNSSSVSVQYKNDTTDRYQIVLYEYDINKVYIGYSFLNENKATFVLNSNTFFVRVRFRGLSGNSVNDYYNYQIENGSTISNYEPYGEQICINRLDEQTNAINETNNYLKDDSDPAISDDEFTSLFGSVVITNPLDSLLQLPVQFINAIVNQSDSCQVVNLGTLLGVPITLPCIDIGSILGSSVWNTIDILSSIGLIVLILKQIYESITNALTLGGYMDAKKGGLGYMPPLEFLCSILTGWGGDF